MDMMFPIILEPADVDKPLITVTFRNEDVRRDYEEKVHAVIQSMVDYELVAKRCFESVEFYEKADTQSERVAKYEERYPERALKCTFDVDPVPENDRNERTRGPIYYCEDVQIQSVNLNSWESCFNCSENHTLRDCPYPRNHNRISHARRQFHEAKQTSRYHQDADSMYVKYAPGFISARLRRALGIKDDQIPVHIYRMRGLGYPPGWKTKRANIKLYGNGGKTIENAKQYTGENVLYPGFNAPMPAFTRDEYVKYHCSPYQEPEQNVTSAPNTSVDPPEPIRASSPSLIDLEMRKKILLAELKSSCDSPVTMSASNSPLPVTEDIITFDSPESLLDDTTVSSTSAILPVSNDTTCPTDTDNGTLDIEIIEGDTNDVEEPVENDDNGTVDIQSNTNNVHVECKTVRTTTITEVVPIYMREQKYTDLPPLENFAKGMMPEIWVEPTTSTGTFNNIMAVLNKRKRSKLNKPKNM